MDRSISGGMAPALQSSNFHSSDLVNQESKVTGVKEVVLVSHKKVNGNSYGDHQIVCETPITTDTLTTTQNKSADDATSPTANANMIVTESCVLSNLKEALPAVSTPELHLGQGDGVISKSLNHNGWGECKKTLTSCVLQESNMTCNNTHYISEKVNKPNKKVPNDRSSPIIMDTDENTHCNNEDHNINQSNGNIVAVSDKNSHSESTILRSRIETACLVSSFANTATYSTAVTANTSSIFSRIIGTTNTEQLVDSPILTNNIISPVLRQFSEEAKNNATVSIETSTENCKNLVLHSPMIAGKKSVGAMINGEGVCNANKTEISLSAPESNENALQGSIPHLPQVLQYTDLLSSDLSKINVPHKLAHTLQELAASLKGTSLQLSRDAMKDKLQECSVNNNHTVISGSQETLHSSVKSLDFTFEEPSLSERQKELAVKEHNERIHNKVKSAVDGSKLLHDRLQFLRTKVNSLRYSDINTRVKKDLKKLASHTQSLPNCSDQNWECENVNITGLHSSVSGESSNRSLDFWQKLFETSVFQDNQRLDVGISENKFGSKHFGEVTENNKLSASTVTKKEFVIEDQKISADISGMNLDPIVQLTRIEQETTKKDHKSKLLHKARRSADILKKELKFIQSRCDPDITDSSSDEDVPLDSRHEKLTKNYKVAKPVRKYRKSFCKWVAERAEISRRWTWLQSRISTLEFSIRQEGDLYAQFRNSKGAVQLEAFAPNSCDYVDASQAFSANEQTTPINYLHSCRRSQNTDTSYTNRVPESTPPCNVNQLLSNVQHQSARLFNNLSPLSGGSPSPIQQPANSSSVNIQAKVPDNKSTPTTKVGETCARTNHLCLSTFNKRKMIKLSSEVLNENKLTKPKTVPNDSSIMCVERKSLFQFVENFKSFSLKAALHDHSYHTVISSTKDIPLSISMRAVMKSKRKWCQKSDSNRHQTSIKSDSKESRYKHKKKENHRAQKRKESSHSMLPPNHFDDTSDSKRRKFINHSSTSSKKRSRGASFDSDLESPVVVGGFNPHQTSRGSNNGATTPTEMATYNQNYWKKKRSSEHSYDINNIVIPHGLNTARIEKLAYKEIQTPSWKVVELDDVKEEVIQEHKEQKHVIDSEAEEITSAAFQRRHDHYEIIEKRKFMAYMEWSLSRKSRGSRMSNLRDPGASEEPTSPASLSYTPSPVSFSGDPFSAQTSTGAISLTTAPPNSSPTAKPGVTTRRMSTDHYPVKPATLLPPLQNQHINNNDTSLAQNYTSPDYSNWQDGLGSGSRYCSQEISAAVNRTLSEGANTNKNHFSIVEMWEARIFPLVDDDLRMLNDIEYAIEKMRENMQFNIHQHMDDEFDNCSKRCLVGRQNGFEKPSHFPAASTMRSFSHEVMRSDQQHFKPGSGRRRRTDSRASSFASYDDAGRYSDASSTSVSSTARRKSRKSRGSQSFASLPRKEFASGKGSRKHARLSRTLQSKHNYLHMRLSETDNDSLSDFDSDSGSSDDTTTSFDDAGHLVDDFADPEWEYNPIKQRDRR